MTGDVVRCWEK